MNKKYFGDSYDIVKQSLIRWLGGVGPWSVHPMFTDSASTKIAGEFARLIGARCISTEILGAKTDRVSYLAVARGCRTHLFLDPDTGIAMKRPSRKRSPLYLLTEEVVEIVRARPEQLTLVFDQSVARGREHAHMRKKLGVFKGHGLHGTAYFSHTCFVLLGLNAGLVRTATNRLSKESKLPAHRFIGTQGES